MNFKTFKKELSEMLAEATNPEIPIEVSFDKVKEFKAKYQDYLWPEKKKYLERRCPECGNEKFEILEVVRKPSYGKAGHYRCKCTVCEFTELAITKQPYGFKETEHKRGRVSLGKNEVDPDA